MAESLLRPLEVGEILDGAFTMYRRHFATFFGTALLAVAPVVAVSATFALEPGDPGTLGVGVFMVLFVAIPFTAIGWAALTRQFADAVHGRPVTVAEGYRHGLRAFPRLLGAGILAYVLVMVVGSIAVAALGILMLALGNLDGTMGAATVGFVVVALGLIVVAAVSLFAITAAVVIERSGPWQAIRRSWALARGAWPRVAGVVLVSWLIVLLPTVGLATIGAVVGTSAAVQPAGALAMADLLLGPVISALTYPFLVGVLTLLYFDRRVRTEAYDLEVAADGLAVSP